MITGKVFLTTGSAQETERMGEIIGEIIGSVIVEEKFRIPLIALNGDLGAGKTVLVRGMVRGLGIDAGVRSPTFTLCNVYHGPVPVLHFDFYRIEDEEELHILDLEEHMEGNEGVVFIEWADKFPHVLPLNRLDIYVNRDYNDNEVSANDNDVSANDNDVNGINLFDVDKREIIIYPRSREAAIIIDRFMEVPRYNGQGMLNL